MIVGLEHFSLVAQEEELFVGKWRHKSWAESEKGAVYLKPLPGLALSASCDGAMSWAVGPLSGQSSADMLVFALLIWTSLSDEHTLCSPWPAAFQSKNLFPPPRLREALHRLLRDQYPRLRHLRLDSADARRHSQVLRRWLVQSRGGAVPDGALPA